MSDAPPSGDSGFNGQWRPEDSTSQFNRQVFLVKQLLALINTATLVQVQSCTNDGGVTAVGFVDVLPLVNLVDGAGQSSPHGIVHSLPYARLQGGKNAVIADPEKGDIGVAVFADRDISAVKANKAQANPGSRRRFDMADGVYLFGVLNGVPEQYVQFNSDGMKFVDKNGNSITMNSSGISFADCNGNTLDMGSTGFVLTGDVATTGTLKNNGVNVGSTHTHSGVTSGSSDTGPPV